MTAFESFIQKNLNDKAIYWGNPQPDGYGGYTFDDPVEVNCRWEDKQEQTRTEKGEELSIQSQIIVKESLEKGGYLLKGTLNDISSDPSDPRQEGASRIMQKIGTPGISGTVLNIYKLS